MARIYRGEGSERHTVVVHLTEAEARQLQRYVTRPSGNEFEGWTPTEARDLMGAIAHLQNALEEVQPHAVAARPHQ